MSRRAILPSTRWCPGSMMRPVRRCALPVGPFTGVPYLLKDLGAHYTGAITSFGSRFFADYRPDHDSELTARLKCAGLVIFGKTNTPSSGSPLSTEPRLFGATRNPWHLAYSAAVRAAAPRRRWPPGCCRWRTPPTVGAPSGFPRRAAVSSA